MFKFRFTALFYLLGAVCVALTILSHLLDELVIISNLAVIALFFVLLIDILQLYSSKHISCKRIIPDRLSNGDFNTIEIHLIHQFKHRLHITIYDEMPYQLQIANFALSGFIEPNKSTMFSYQIKPTERGEYEFNNLNVFIGGSLLLFERKLVLEAHQTVPVYPSFMQMQEYEFMAFSSIQKKEGIKRIRRIGQSREFEQVKHYVQGDDTRFINWNATARKSEIMVNQYQDEISQNIYSVIDMGRNMKMPFHGMSLLDYSINSVLATSNIILKKYDRAGLLTFSHIAGNFLKADSQRKQLKRISDHLYHQKTSYLESNFELLYHQSKTMIKGRSLIMLYTNFEGLSSMRRQLKYLKAINAQHVLLVIFFENTELYELTQYPAETLEDVYTKTIGMQFVMEKQLIVKELKQHGIYTLLTDPKNLSIHTINKYIEFKHRGLI